MDHPDLIQIIGMVIVGIALVILAVPIVLIIKFVL